MADRVRRAFDAWKVREVTSNRLFGTGIGFLLIGIPFSLWFLVVGPTAGDRLVALGFLIGAGVLGVYSLWESKNLDLGRSDPDDGAP